MKKPEHSADEDKDEIEGMTPKPGRMSAIGGIGYLRIGRRMSVDETNAPDSAPEGVSRHSGKIIPYERFLEKHRVRYGFDPWTPSDADDSETEDDSEAAEPETPHRMERIMDVRKKIEEGFYRRPEVLEETMRRLIQSMDEDGAVDPEARDSR